MKIKKFAHVFFLALGPGPVENETQTCPSSVASATVNLSKNCEKAPNNVQNAQNKVNNAQNVHFSQHFGKKTVIRSEMRNF